MRGASLDPSLCDPMGSHPPPRRVQKLLALIPSALEWTLMDRAPLKTWVHEDGRLALLGDACHPMLVRMSWIFLLRPGWLILFACAAVQSAGICHGREYRCSVFISSRV